LAEAQSSPVSAQGGDFPRHLVAWMNLLGVRVSAVDMKTAVAIIFGAVKDGRKGYVCLRDVRGVEWLFRLRAAAPVRTLCRRGTKLSVAGRAAGYWSKGIPHVSAGRDRRHADHSRLSICSLSK
jgi:N-acetylglucosaminyldiphosphoundecaprenol N-acetyl-beta-D-mannosaminyltransferase